MAIVFVVDQSLLGESNNDENGKINGRKLLRNMSSKLRHQKSKWRPPRIQNLDFESELRIKNTVQTNLIDLDLYFTSKYRCN